MIQALFLIASLANAQSTGTISVSLEDQIKVSNLGKAVRDLESGRYKQTGKPTFLGGICFADGTCQTTGSGSSGASLTSTQTFSGANTFTSSLTFTASKVRGISGGVLASSISITGATSTTLNGLDGNTENNWRITIDGIMTGLDTAIMQIRPNNDSTAGHYRGLMNQNYGSGTRSTAFSTGFDIHSNPGNQTCDVHCVGWMKANAGGNLGRTLYMNCGFESQSSYAGFDHIGGYWTDTATNITSLVFVWVNAFTGSVWVYQD